MYRNRQWPLACWLIVDMRTWALGFLIVALIAAALGFGGGIGSVAFAAAARPVFYGAVALFLVSLSGILMPRV